MHTIHPFDIGPVAKLGERDASDLLAQEIKVSVGRRKMDRAIRSHFVNRNRGAVGTGRLPLIDQSTDTGHVLLGGLEDGIDVTRGTDDPMPNHRDASDKDVVDLGSV